MLEQSGIVVLPIPAAATVAGAATVADGGVGVGGTVGDRMLPKSASMDSNLTNYLRRAQLFLNFNSAACRRRPPPSAATVAALGGSAVAPAPAVRPLASSCSMNFNNGGFDEFRSRYPELCESSRHQQQQTQQQQQLKLKAFGRNGATAPQCEATTAPTCTNNASPFAWHAADADYDSAAAKREIYSDMEPCTSLPPPPEASGPTKIFDFLFLGSMDDALDEKVLKERGISRVINISECCPRPASIGDDAQHYLKISVKDNNEAKLLPRFDDAFKFIESARRAGEKVLLHCQAGISRSPTLAIAYVIRWHGVGYQEAYDFVKRRRATIEPNISFIVQLMNYAEARAKIVDGGAGAGAAEMAAAEPMVVEDGDGDTVATAKDKGYCSLRGDDRMPNHNDNKTSHDNHSSVRNRDDSMPSYSVPQKCVQNERTLSDAMSPLPYSCREDDGKVKRKNGEKAPIQKAKYLDDDFALKKMDASLSRGSSPSSPASSSATSSPHNGGAETTRKRAINEGVAAKLAQKGFAKKAARQNFREGGDGGGAPRSAENTPSPTTEFSRLDISIFSPASALGKRDAPASSDSAAAPAGYGSAAADNCSRTDYGGADTVGDAQTSNTVVETSEVNTVEARNALPTVTVTGTVEENDERRESSLHRPESGRILDRIQESVESVPRDRNAHNHYDTRAASEDSDEGFEILFADAEESATHSAAPPTSSGGSDSNASPHAAADASCSHRRKNSAGLEISVN